VFNNTKCISVIHVYHSSQFYCWRNPEYPEKTTNLPQVTGNTLSPKVVSSTPRHEQDWNPQRRWWYALIAQIVINLTTIQPPPPPPIYLLCLTHMFYIWKSFFFFLLPIWGQESVTTVKLDLSFLGYDIIHCVICIGTHRYIQYICLCMKNLSWTI
jgi:hypothetical protein